MPEGWAWTKIHCVSSEILYGVSESAKEKGKYKLLRITDIQDDKVNWDSVPFTDFPEDKITNYILKNGDIVFARTGATVGKSYLIENLTVESIYASYLIRIRTSLMLNPKYMKYYFGSLTYWNQITDKSSGIGQPNVNGTSLANLYIPIPPYNEQERILPVIEKAFRLINSLENNKSALQTAIKQAKSKILDLAIHGKLVPQDPNDEPAVELLKRIATSDNRPYKKFEGEEPFEIPDSWAWCTGNDIFNPMTSKKPYGETFRYIDIDAIDNKKHCVIQPKTIAVSEAPSRASRELNNGDVLFSLVRPYLENIALIEKENTDCIASTGFYVCKPKDFIFPKFLFYLMTSEYVIKGLNQFMKGDNSPSINGDDIKNWLYPLPPLAEQQQIVTKIEELFTQLDSISEQLA